MIFEIHSSHIYRGIRGTLPDSPPDIAPGGRLECMVVFSDSAMTHATLTRNAGGYRLSTAGYRTAAGTDIAPKDWLVEFDAGQAGSVFKVTGKL